MLNKNFNKVLNEKYNVQYYNVESFIKHKFDMLSINSDKVDFMSELLQLFTLDGEDLKVTPTGMTTIIGHFDSELEYINQFDEANNILDEHLWFSYNEL